MFDSQSTDVLDLLASRGYVAQVTDEPAVRALLSNPPAVVYQGFDPTKDSLHVGHLQSLMVLHYLQQAGHRVILVLGGGTALIGDPSGRSAGRQMISAEAVLNNKLSIRAQIQGMGLLDFDEERPGLPIALMFDNADWLAQDLLSFLRAVLPHFSVNEMVKRDTFRERLQSQQNLSLLEFFYPALQGFDFLYLNQHFGCRLQVGGNDQWPNILDGVDLIRRKTARSTYGLTFPLLTDRKGNKMGKTAGGETIWLADQGENSTNPFSFYQFWLRTADTDIERNLKIFTFLSLEEIEQLAAGEPRAAQHCLAYEVTRIVHGDANARSAQADSLRVFGDLEGTVKTLPTLLISYSQLDAGFSITDALVAAGVVHSRGTVRRLASNGGIRLNDGKVEDPSQQLSPSDFVPDQGGASALVRYGKGKAIQLIFEESGR